MSNLTIVSSSEVDTYRQCRLKHQLLYLELWRTDEESEALARGTLYHSVMEAHYGVLKQLQEEGIAPEAIDFFAAVKPLLYGEEGVQSDRQELVEWIYRGYCERYGPDPDWEIVSIEEPLEAPLPGSDAFNLKGTVDLIVRDRSAGGGLWLVDHKTCKYLPKKDFDLEDQTAVYAYLLMQQGWDIRGAIYNHCRTDRLKTKPTPMEDRFKRSFTVRTPKELETCALEVLDLMEEAYSRDVSERDAPRSPDGERCGWKCNLTEACLTGRKYGPERMRQYLVDTGFRQHETKPGPTFNKVAV